MAPPGSNATRLPSEVVAIRLGGVPDAAGETLGHELAVALAWHPDTGALQEIAFVGRGKSGQGLDLLLAELGVKLTRAIQGRDPETGVPLATGQEPDERP